ncbi:MAG: FAD-dependent oxidoreductase [Candidatus Nanopelagicales bacterium]|nr:FAD-dependent oxidoreductase [Candidatus Nanopelagicales bacterium]
MSDYDFDVIVVGSGAAGLSAALAASEDGASVLVVESQGIVGGSSRLSGGLMMGAGTRYQKALGIEDSPEALFHDYMTLNQWKVESAVVERLTQRAGAAVEWLGDLGVEFYDEMVFGGDETVPRVHCPIGRGQAVVDVLHARCRERGVEFALGQRIDRLIVEHGAVRGVAVGDDSITAEAVVVASGGFGANEEKRRELFPSVFDTEWSYYIGADGAQGDALDFTRDVDAQITGFNRGLRLMHTDFDKMYEAYIPGWLILVNRDGRRFCNETAPYGIMDGLLSEQGDVAFAIFDHTRLVEATELGVARYKQSIPGSTKRQSPHWNLDIIEMMIKEGKVHVADSVGQLASSIGVPAQHLQATVDRTNELHELHEDIDYLKDPKFLEPITDGPFYGVEVRPATCCFTACGLRIDREGQVLDSAGRPIAGLFAAGEVAGGVIGPRYVGSGNSYGNWVTMGRVAGQSAAAVSASVGAAT